MKISAAMFISRWKFSWTYRLWSKEQYRQFLKHIDKQLACAVDDETELISLSFRERWKDQAHNVHASFMGAISRRGETASVGAIIVWLRKIRSFRGVIWSTLEPKSDAELLGQARTMFYAGRYAEFMEISQHVKAVHLNSRAFQKMRDIAQRRIRFHYKRKR